MFFFSLLQLDLVYSRCDPLTDGVCKQYTSHVSFSRVFCYARVHITLAQVVPCLKKVVSSPRHPHVSYAPVVCFSLGLSLLLVLYILFINLFSDAVPNHKRTPQRGHGRLAPHAPPTQGGFSSAGSRRCSRPREPSR